MTGPHRSGQMVWLVAGWLMGWWHVAGGWLAGEPQGPRDALGGMDLVQGVPII